MSRVLADACTGLAFHFINEACPWIKKNQLYIYYRRFRSVNIPFSVFPLNKSERLFLERRCKTFEGRNCFEKFKSYVMKCGKRIISGLYKYREILSSSGKRVVWGT